MSDLEGNPLHDTRCLLQDLEQKGEVEGDQLYDNAKSSEASVPQGIRLSQKELCEYLAKFKTLLGQSENVEMPFKDFDIGDATPQDWYLALAALYVRYIECCVDENYKTPVLRMMRTIFEESGRRPSAEVTDFLQEKVSIQDTILEEMLHLQNGYVKLLVGSQLKIYWLRRDKLDKLYSASEIWDRTVKMPQDDTRTVALMIEWANDRELTFSRDIPLIEKLKQLVHLYNFACEYSLDLLAKAAYKYTKANLPLPKHWESYDDFVFWTAHTVNDFELRGLDPDPEGPEDHYGISEDWLDIMIDGDKDPAIDEVALDKEFKNKMQDMKNSPESGYVEFQTGMKTVRKKKKDQGKKSGI